MTHARPVVVGMLPTLALAAVAAIGVCGSSAILSAQQSPFAINPMPPTELNAAGGGPAKATLQQAAEFAWQEFFALNWPAVPQTGQANQRDMPSLTCAFGDQSQSCAGPLVWETFRGKVEIFPGSGPPNGYDPKAPSFGYDALPQYNYGPLHPIVACTNPTPLPPTAWVNLDETDQITVDSMYAGVVTVAPSPLNSAPQLIRFLAKANRAEYAYVAGHQWWDGSAPTLNTANFVAANKADPTDPDHFVVLPTNTIEVKTGWRVLNPAELTGGRFHTATVRYYEKNTSGGTCYQQATFGLVALHIIQKTALAPYFIYASFEQADNILNAQGQPIEDRDGAPQRPPQACRLDQTAPCPTTPSVTLNDTATVTSSMVPPQVVLVPPTAAYCTSGTNVTPPNQLFYLNTNGLPALPTGGYICINKRDNDIPPVIIETNKRAHELIERYSAEHGVKSSIWQNYKLVNVQYLPLNKNHASLYGSQPGENDPDHANNPHSYYLANIVVETNRPLQLFSGGLVAGSTTGANSDYASQFESGATGIHSNVFQQGQGYNMGGCMGCHGSQGQSQGGNFSVIMARGPVRNAETPALPSNVGAAKSLRNRELK